VDDAYVLSLGACDCCDCNEDDAAFGFAGPFMPVKIKLIIKKKKWKFGKIKILLLLFDLLCITMLNRCCAANVHSSYLNRY
jgi:hypothetical protein